MNSVVFLQKHFPHLVEDMQNSQHHFDWENLNPHHLEGDVWSHQMMVMSQVRDRKVNEIVELAALCHDLGKPLCRDPRPDKKRVRFSGHAGVGVFLAVDVLKAWGMDNKMGWLQAILETVSWHQDIFQEIGDDGQVNQKTLRLFAGQSHEQMKVLLDLMTCDGNGRFAAHKPYEDDFQSMLLSQFEEAMHVHIKERAARKVQFVQETPNLKKRKIHILVGPPLSGKTTWVFNNTVDAFLISRDECILDLAPGLTYNEAWQVVDQKEVDKLLQVRWNKAKKSDKDIVVDMTNMSRKSRRKWLNGLPRHMEKCAVVFATGKSVLDQRNVEREGKHIPDSVLLSMMKKFSAPTLSEFDSVKWVF